MKSPVLLTVALLVGAALLARLSLREEPTEVTALEPRDAPVAADFDASVERKLLAPSAHRSDLTPSAPSAPEGSRDAPPSDAPTAVELLVVHERSKNESVPLAGIRVFLVHREADVAIARTLLGTTDLHGRLKTELSASQPRRFEADARTLPRGVGTTGPLESSHDVQVFGHRQPPLPQDEVETLTLRLPSAGTLVVTARGPGGRPAAGAVVEVWLRSAVHHRPVSWSRVGRVAKTDEDGVATLEDLRAGEMYVGIATRDSGTAPPPPQRVVLAPDAQEHLTFELGTGQVVLRGRVIDETGVPVAGVAVDARYDLREPGAPLPQHAQRVRPSGRARTTVTDDAGRFQLEGLSAGPYLLFFDLAPSMARIDERRLLPAPVVVRAVGTLQGGALLHAVDDVVLPRVELFVVKGRVVFDEDLLEEGVFTLRDLRPQLGDIDSKKQARCDYDPRSGVFEVACKLPLERLTLIVRPRLHGTEVPLHSFGRSRRGNALDPAFETAQPREFTFAPEAGVVLEDVELRYP